MNEEAERQAEAHWLYVENVLQTHGIYETTITECGFHYKTAFVHGFKHGVEWKNEQAVQTRQQEIREEVEKIL